jgi:hypothetical protein
MDAITFLGWLMLIETSNYKLHREVEGSLRMQCDKSAKELVRVITRQTRTTRHSNHLRQPAFPPGP